VAPHDRAGLEQLCRYGLRAPFALDRISIAPNGNVLYQLHRPWPKPNSPRTHLTFEPVAFLRRLAALVPSPYQNLIRYHGVFANRSRLRPLLPAPPGSPAPVPETPQTEMAPVPPVPSAPPPPKRHRYSWAHQLKRSLRVDALVCPKFATLLRVLAFLSDPAVVTKILDHLRLPSSAPPLAPARMPEDEFPFFQDTEFAGDDFEDPDCRPTQPKNPQRPGRGPPYLGFRTHPPSHFFLTCQSRTGPDRSIPFRPFVRKMDAHRLVSHPRKPPLSRNHCSLTSV
jgi:hypothetical protein